MQRQYRERVARLDDGVRIAELVATLSYGADLGLGQPMSHCMRQTVIALRLADILGADQQEREATYYLGLMINSYCHADAAEQASWFGDDIAFKAVAFELMGMSTAQMVSFLLRKAAENGSGWERAQRIATLPTGRRRIASWVTTHAALGSQMAVELGLSSAVQTAVSQAYEQWDGKGYPNALHGEDICLATRVVQLAGAVEVYDRHRGPDQAVAAARRHREGEFDPHVIDAFCSNAHDVLDELDEEASWDAVLDAEPWPQRRVNDGDLDDALEAIGDAVDLKSPHLAGHSRGVASLAAEGARVAGMDARSTTDLHRAGLVHDLGRLGVSNALWDRPAPLTDSEQERVRLHPYLTDRMLARVPALSKSRVIASRHHERLDGSGYPHGLTASSLSSSDRLLAAADSYHAMTEPRPYRTPFPDTVAARRLTEEVKAGRLDGDAVASILVAAGHRAPSARRQPSGLTAREVEVLGLLARGHTNKQIARLLAISPKTVSNHIEHVYSKLGVGSRASATLCAIQQGLVGSYEAPTGPALG